MSINSEVAQEIIHWCNISAYRLTDSDLMLHNEWVSKLIEQENKKTCDWCGKDGEFITRHYHQECHEAILNGEGMI